MIAAGSQDERLRLYAEQLALEPLVDEVFALLERLNDDLRKELANERA
jgi:hypothetical protein